MHGVARFFIYYADRIIYFDTAEIYTGGKSEELLADCIRRGGRPPVVASKYMPNESRKTKKDFVDALDGSLKRLGVKTIDLYYIHSPPKAQSIEELIGYMAKALVEGKIRSIGVSNFDVLQLTKAVDILEEYGLKLAANQVEYSLLNRDPEKNGVLEACKSMNVSLVAYRPLARGRLTSDAMNGSSL
ncbi:MAG: aldo/keto reductase, partial [Nitrosomonadales bacterium]